MDILSFLNAREQATLIWVLILVVWALSKPPIRKSLYEVLKSLSNRKILSIIALMFIYISLMILFFKEIGFWDTLALKDTLIWVFGVAFVSLVNINDVAKKEDYFKIQVVESIKLIVVIEFIVNLYSFSLMAELIIIPLVSAVVAMSAVAELKVGYKTVKKMLDTLLAIFGLVLLFFTFRQIQVDLGDFASLKNLRDFLLPIFFTAMYLPFLYLVAIYTIYELLFVRIEFTNKDDPSIIKLAKKRAFGINGLNLTKLRRFTKEARIYKYQSADAMEAAFTLRHNS